MTINFHYAISGLYNISARWGNPRSLKMMTSKIVRHLMSTNNEDDLAKELDPILDSYGEPKQEAINEEQAQAFMERFESIKVQIIKPIMELIGKYLEKKGHAYSISEKMELYNHNPSIAMEIYPRTSTNVPMQEHEFPIISFIAEPNIEKVGVQVQDGMPGHPGLIRGHTTDIDSLTREYVRNQIITVLGINFVPRVSKSSRAQTSD
jgi:hypothetical protein